MGLPQTVDVVVVGGGIVGAASAAAIAARGRSVVLLEKEDDVAREGSSRAQGSLRVQGRHGAEFPLALEALELWKEAAAEAAGTEPGRLIVARPEASTRGALNGESLAGMEGDLVRLIAKRNCLEADVVRVGAGDSASAEVEQGSADLALGFWHRGEEGRPGLRPSETIVVDANDSGGRGAEERARLSWAAPAANESLSEAIDDEIRALRENGMISDLLEKRGLDPDQAEVPAPLR